ncbi:MAG TPA: uracil-DNA glycosylase family protein [Methylocella sp.]|nr:uracil-DNA glycosylase family protein [Methylocella sp.]
MMPPSDENSTAALAALTSRIRACRICIETPHGAGLAHDPRPVLRVSASAKLLVASQAPGVRVHQTGLPFNDASGDRLRMWMGLSREVFYDEAKVAIVPMGFCFPGHDAHKGDLPPRRECRATWHDQLFANLPQISTILAIGRYAQDYHFARRGGPRPIRLGVDETIRRWPEFIGDKPRVIALPHPSWRNNGWIKRNPWFEAELLPALRREVQAAIS